MRLLSILTSSVVVLFTIQIAHISRILPHPYMDEVFHITQTQQFCSGFFDYHPLITTPPGLYFVAVPFALPFNCSIISLRIVNGVISLFIPLLVYYLLLELSPRNGSIAWLQAIEVFSFPLLYSTYFLFYTDALSLTLVLLSYLLCLRGRTNLSSIIGIGSVFVRQTNIVWVGLIAGFSLIDEFHSRSPMDKISLPRFFQYVVSNVWAITTTYIGFIITGLGFLLFLYVNHGVTLGDRENHQMSVHIPQILYFSAICCLSLRANSLPRWKDFIVPWRFIILSCLLGYFAVKYCTYEHPFLLSDNRHLVFYIWKDLFRMYPNFRFAILPFYSICIHLLYIRLKHLGFLKVALLCLCISATLIPSPLIEVRYFIIPFVFVFLHTEGVSRRVSLFNIATNYIANWILFYIFDQLAFIAPDGSTARIMW